MRVTVGRGVRTLEADEDPAALFAGADEALYQDKLEGRNQVQFTDRAAD